MNLKNAINFKELKSFFESKGFAVTSQSGDLFFTSPYGHYIAVSQPWKDSDMVYLDCNLINTAGLRDFIREWSQGTNLYDYIVNVCYPILRNLKGSPTLYENPDSVIDYVKKTLKEKNVEYDFSNSADITYICCAPQRELYENTIKYKLFSFYKRKIKYGIILKQFNSLYLARFKDDSNTVFFEYPWHSFCPIYKTGKEYIKTTIENFLEFIEQDSDVV